MKIYDVLMLCGTPALIASLVAYIVTRIKNKHDNRVSHNESLAAGMQVMLRIQLTSLAEKYLAKGYCTVEERELFTAVYNAYHNLGKNGVMDDLLKKVMSLPLQTPLVIIN